MARKTVVGGPSSVVVSRLHFRLFSLSFASSYGLRATYSGVRSLTGDQPGVSPPSNTTNRTSTIEHPSYRIATLLQFLEDDPTDPFTRFALAQEYLKHGDTETAKGYFEAVKRDSPHYVGVYYHLGKLYETLGQTEAATATYRAGIEVAQRQKAFHDLAELRGALLEAEGLGFDDETG